MSHVMIIGGGLSGSTVAAELAEYGVDVTIVEKSDRIGGKVRDYGCKATDKCNNCGLCLTGGLWEKVEKNQNIEILGGSKLVDLTGSAGDFSAIVKNSDGLRYINGISSVVVATGFEESPVLGGHLQIEGKTGIIRGLELEALCKTRSKNEFFERAPKSVAFIQCVGSRDKKEDSLYCSRVCCSYSTRAAKVIRYYYPECEITFYYMEIQAVSNGDYFKQLEGMDIGFLKCRPLKIKAGTPVSLEYEDPVDGEIKSREYDYVMLSDGIHPPKDADRIAEICGLGQDSNGFLKSIGDGVDRGVFVSGCAKKPAKIEEVYSDSIAVARQVITAMCQ